jgi:putative SbcD/Mre11-related phosphoesterase
MHQLGPWDLTPEGAAIHARERAAVIADVHLGYEWARGAAGDCVPAHSLEETLARLAGVLARASINRLIVAGDLVESGRPCRRTGDDVRRLTDWLASRGVTLLALEGNHDRSRLGMKKTLVQRSATCTLDGWTIAHGHRPIAGERTISGHVHPTIRVDGFAAPCFLAGPTRIVLPAFSSNAAGSDVRAGPVPREWIVDGLRCIASTGYDLLDLGPLSAIRRVRGPRA